MTGDCYRNLDWDEQRGPALASELDETSVTGCASCSPGSGRSRGFGSEALETGRVHSSVSPSPTGHGDRVDSDATDGFRPVAGQVAGDAAPLLFTPSQAAQLLQVRESWLRRRAARRLVPCTFLGKHLRFSRA